jgi:hypothetical protein
MKHKTSAKIFAEHARGEHNHFRTLKRKGKLYIPVEDRPINSVPGSFNIQAPEKISIFSITTLLGNPLYSFEIDHCGILNI